MNSSKGNHPPVTSMRSRIASATRRECSASSVDIAGSVEGEPDEVIIRPHGKETTQDTERRESSTPCRADAPGHERLETRQPTELARASGTEGHRARRQ